MPAEHGKSLTHLHIKQKKYLERKVDLEMTPKMHIGSLQARNRQLRSHKSCSTNCLKCIQIADEGGL